MMGNLINMEWVKEEAGWYTSKVGGICQERDKKWYYYPITSTPTHIFEERQGPFDTLTEAKRRVGK